ncbi:hypothetical protein FDJ20_gp158 [Vibrio phage Thalassa]|uniref:Uncharacterized protein n=1 Tax=Vibrio phage Thalassa TaxID=2570301 RepID=A0A2H5BH93_9CAUD|nr:hypothetical protein FDJ20_gp158 [Vibrio phage Thalassa]AUG85344.1 hypothetical protein THALASSA_165 [Vibrio phage Thalassa]
MKHNINLPEINKFLDTTHEKNLERLRAKLAKGEWHWLFPDNWVNDAANRNVLFHAINAKLMPKPKFFGSAS